MVEMIGKISKGSKMDQIYLPKNRNGLNSGTYVVISPLNRLENNIKFDEKPKLFYYNTGKLEGLKIKIIEEIINLIDTKLETNNIIITGSFLERSFNFNDIDILIINDDKKNIGLLIKQLENLYGIKIHIIQISKNELIKGMSIDPLYNLMLNKCVSKNRLIFNIKRNINYKLLDLNLLKSKTLIDNFDILNGKEKYYFTMNMISILIFIEGKKLTKEVVNNEIENLFDKSIDDIKYNLLNKDFLSKFKKIYNKTLNLILENIKKERKHGKK